jgi:hypothetical protein
MIDHMRDPARRMRAYLLATLGVGMIGMAAELLLIGHRETAQQQIPLALLGVGVAALVWHAAAPRVATVRVLQIVMLLFVLSGAVGVVLHYRGNVEFELEMYPAMNGLELVQKTFTGATPVLAPGSMTLLGLIGLTHTYKHPCLDRGASALRHEEGDA